MPRRVSAISLAVHEWRGASSSTASLGVWLGGADAELLHGCTAESRARHGRQAERRRVELPSPRTQCIVALHRLQLHPLAVYLSNIISSTNNSVTSNATNAPLDRVMSAPAETSVPNARCKRKNHPTAYSSPGFPGPALAAAGRRRGVGLRTGPRSPGESDRAPARPSSPWRRRPPRPVCELPPLTSLIPQLDRLTGHRPRLDADEHKVWSFRRVSAAVAVAPTTGTVTVVLAHEHICRFAHASPGDRRWGAHASIVLCDSIEEDRLMQYSLSNGTLSPACDGDIVESPPPSPHSIVDHLVTCCYSYFWNKGLIYCSRTKPTWGKKRKWRLGV
ncbi:hypothetical protein C2845_PM02G35560 [Panicum miliaceum]|uniref:Uncharacterized protein n=1 Tax=Panicum miliaceum TaxID=4540 RepID=A0A3L6S8F6_PANMI|nr:hypothetical protein C2845_PM02G35560 [Panicum miliaceum]